MISSEGGSKVANNKQPPVGVRSGYTRLIKKCNDGVSSAGPYGGVQPKPSTTFTHLYRTERPAPFAGPAAGPARVVRRHGFDGFVGSDQIVMI